MEVDARKLQRLLSGQLHTFLLSFPILRSLYGLSTAEFLEVEAQAWFCRERSMDVCVAYDDSTSSECSAINNVSLFCVCAKLLQAFATLSIVARQVLPCMGFSRQKYWSELPFPSPGDLPRDRTHVSYVSCTRRGFFAITAAAAVSDLGLRFPQQDTIQSPRWNIHS